MNIRLRNTYFFSCVFLMFALQGNLFSQNFDPPVFLEVVEGQSYDYQFQHIGNPAQTYVVGTNHHGSYPTRPASRGGGNYSLVYSANSGTTGLDSLSLYLRKPPSGQATWRKIFVNVIPSKVLAEDDFVPLSVNQSLTFSVSGNDYSNRGVLNITDISMVNNGVATIVNNQVSFTPDTGFEGLANFNYVVCDDVGTCDKATVHVCVGDPYSYGNDTMEIITIKNTRVPVFTPLAGYSISQSPSNGSMITSNGILGYEPNSNWSGTETVVYSNASTGFNKTLLIDVMNVDAPNTYVNDDLAYALVDQNFDTYVSVLDNDLYGSLLRNVQVITQPQHGTVSNPAPGLFTYRPNSGFEGVDRFTYSASPNQNGSGAEIGEVNVIVSDQNPALPTFELRTPKNTPLVIDYNIPVSGYGFNITNNPASGSVVYYPGHLDTLLNGFEVVGNNILIYYPNNNSTGLDQFEIEYCVNGNNNCPTVKVKVDVQDNGNSINCIGADCVWPGDSNLDGIVDLRDLLPTGWCIGDVGVQRPNASINPWYGQDSDNWGISFPHTDNDLKHLDANGDSIVNVLDTLAISQHYRKFHSLSAEPINFPSNIPLFLGAPDTIHVSGPGDTVRMPIILGDPNLPALDMYGLTFSIDFDPTVINAVDSRITFDNQSWVNYTSPALHMIKKPFDGRLDAGYTRTSGVPSNGYGKIGYVDFVIIEDVEFQRLPEFIYARISGSVMNGSGTGMATSESFLKIKLNDNDIQPDPNHLMLFPNPAFDFVNYRMVNGAEIKGYVEIFDLGGKKVLQQKHNDLNGQIYTGKFTPGFYVLRIKTDTGAVTKKFEVLSGK